jgi:RNA polymerase sigma-70 factor, ECF subfamily
VCTNSAGPATRTNRRCPSAARYCTASLTAVPSSVGQALTFSRAGAGGAVRPALVSGAAGVVVVQDGRRQVVFGFTVARGRIVAIDILADPARLSRLDLAVLDK